MKPDDTNQLVKLWACPEEKNAWIIFPISKSAPILDSRDRHSLIFRLESKLYILIKLIARAGSAHPESPLSYAALGSGCWGFP